MPGDDDDGDDDNGDDGDVGSGVFGVPGESRTYLVKFILISFHAIPHYLLLLKRSQAINNEKALLFG